MARFISADKNPFRSFWRKFNSLDLFTRLAIITLILIVIATPFIVQNYQLFNARGETQTQRLQTIAQLQKSQEDLRDIFVNPPTRPPVFASANTKATSAGNFNLIDALQRIFIRMIQVFIK
jgi:hypothetical protein